MIKAGAEQHTQKNSFKQKTVWEMPKMSRQKNWKSTAYQHAQLGTLPQRSIHRHEGTGPSFHGVTDAFRLRHSTEDRERIGGEPTIHGTRHTRIYR